MAEKSEEQKALEAKQDALEKKLMSKVGEKLKEASQVIDELLEVGSVPAVTILGMMAMGWSKDTQQKVMMILRRDPDIRKLLDEKDKKDDKTK